jgi:hypothetical protein
MDLLSLVRSTALECNVIESEDEIASTAGQRGDILRVINWVIAAWRELQTSRRTWRFMRSRFSVDTVSGTKRYAPTDCTDTIDSSAISAFRNWFVDNPSNPPKMYLTSGGVGSQYYVEFVSWDDFQSIFEIGTVSTGQPQNVSVDPQNNLVFWPTPNAIYTFTGDYHRGEQVFVAGTDDATEPLGLPSMFHWSIIYDAMRKYASAESADEILYRCDNEGAALKKDLLRDQSPRFKEGSPMA